MFSMRHSLCRLAVTTVYSSKYQEYCYSSKQQDDQERQEGIVGRKFTEMRWLFAATWVIMIGTPAIALEWNTRTLAAKRVAIWGKLNMQDKATNKKQLGFRKGYWKREQEEGSRGCNHSYYRYLHCDRSSSENLLLATGCTSCRATAC